MIKFMQYIVKRPLYISVILVTIMILRATLQRDDQQKVYFSLGEILAFLPLAFHYLFIMVAVIMGVSTFDAYFYQDFHLKHSSKLLTSFRLILDILGKAIHQLRYWILSLGITKFGLILAIGIRYLLGLERICVDGRDICVANANLLYDAGWLTISRLLIILGAVIIISVLETLACILIGMASAPTLVPKYISVPWGLLIRILPTYLLFLSVDFSSYDVYTFYPLPSLLFVGTSSLLDMGQILEIQMFSRGLVEILIFSGLLLAFTFVSFLISYGLMYLQVSDNFLEPIAD